MSQSRSFDVIVVGGGPGGSVAAKRCAESGFSTLLIEKKRLPRDKVCTGMVMGDWASRTIEEEFGEIPKSVLVDPPYLSGHRLHVAGAEAPTLEWQTPLAWRRDLDFWMVQRAREAGVVVQEGSRIVGVISEEGAYRVTCRSNGMAEDIRARFVIGADGATSIVRRSVFPDLKVRYAAPARECYKGALDLEKDVIHWYFPKGRSKPRFNVNHKNDVFLIEGRAIKELRQEINETLAPHGFQPGSKPEWKDGCAIALLHEELTSGKFVPAERNVLLIGDAAGLILPITFEGIGSALKSGTAAADSILKSTKTGTRAASFYLEGLKPIIEVIRNLCSLQNELEVVSNKGPEPLAEAILAAYRETLVSQSR